MATSASTTERVQTLLGEMKLGAPDAEGRLLVVVQERFRILAHQMLRRFSHLRRLEDTDDLLQHTLIKLNNMLKTFRPESPQAFFATSAKHMRWVLIDLARSYDRENKLRVAQNGDSVTPVNHAHQESAEPLTLDDWAHFHLAVETLSEQEKEVVDLLYYQGHTQDDAADLLGIALRTVKLRWQSAKLNLRRAVLEEAHDG